MKKTSLEAFENIKDKRQTDYKAILSVLNDTPITYKEIAFKIAKKGTIKGFDNPNKVSRRLSELVRLDKIEIHGVRICTIAKSKCSTYIIKKI